MEKQQTPLRTAIMRIMSDMLDNPDKHGIYETGRFMDRIEQLVCDMMAAPESQELSGSEALFGFMGWLTTRDETTIFSPTTVVDVTPISQFIEANGLTEPREAWHELLTHPNPPEPEPVEFVEPTIIEELEAAGYKPVFLDLDLSEGPDEEITPLPDHKVPETDVLKPEFSLTSENGSVFIEGSFDDIVTFILTKIVLQR